MWSPWSHRSDVDSMQDDQGAVKPGPEVAGRRMTMTGGSGAKDAPHPFTDEARALGIDVDDPRALAWMEEHLPEFRQVASGQRPLYWIFGIGFVVGLAAHVGGFLLRSSATTEPLDLVADLLYTWTDHRVRVGGQQVTTRLQRCGDLAPVAVAKPMPLDAPVITIVWSASFLSFTDMSQFPFYPGTWM